MGKPHKKKKAYKKPVKKTGLKAKLLSALNPPLTYGTDKHLVGDLDAVGFKAVRAFFHTLLGAGKQVVCPICDRAAQYNLTTLDSAMSLALILVYNHFVENPEDRWLHLEEFFKEHPRTNTTTRANAPKLRHWGLLSRDPECKEDGNPSTGYYRITEAGCEFVNGRLHVPKAILLYNNKVVGRHAESVTIRTTQKHYFDYTKEVLDAYPVHLFSVEDSA